MLGVEAVGADEGAVLVRRQSSGDGLGGQVVAEAGEVLEVAAGDGILHDSGEYIIKLNIEYIIIENSLQQSTR